MVESCENLARSAIRAPPRKKPVIAIVGETSLHDRLKAAKVCLSPKIQRAEVGGKVNGVNVL